MDTKTHERAHKETTDKDHNEEVFPKDHLVQSWGRPSNMNPLARVASAPMMVIGLIRMVKFLRATKRPVKLCTDGHLIIFDIPSVVSQSDQQPFPSLPYSQEGCRDQGTKEVSDRLRSVRGGDPM